MGALVPVREAKGPAGPRGGIGPGSSGPFGPGWQHEPGPMGLAPGPCDTPKFLTFFYKLIFFQET